MAVTLYTKSGTKSTSKPTLPKGVFNVKEVDTTVLKQVYSAETVNARETLAKTKNRSAVRGGGRKPWRQKGTGRARAGTIRSPLWRGGGVVFGPDTTRNFTRKVNKGLRSRALAQALSLAAKHGRITLIETVDSSGKTKDLAALLTKIGFERGLVVVDESSPSLKRAVNNIAGVSVVEARTLSTGAVLDAFELLLTKPALTVLEQRLEASS